MYNVLMVEDSRNFTLMVERFLGANYRVFAAQTLAAARELLVAQTFDLILLDIMLPDGVGFDLVAELGADRPPLIFLSGRNLVQDRIQGWALGADDYITKPFSPLEFKMRVQNRIEKHKKQRKGSSNEAA